MDNSFLSITYQSEAMLSERISRELKTEPYPIDLEMKNTLMF